MMTTTLQDLKPSQVKPHKLNVRRDVGDVDELAASIKEQGIVEPLIVAPNEAGTAFTLIAGHRRLAAAKVAKLKTVPCLVRDELTDPKAQLELMLVENLQRTDLSPVEEAEAYQQLLTFPGYTQKRITETTGRPAATVRGRLKLVKLPEAIRERVHAGQISLADAATISEFADDVDLVQRLDKSIGTYNFTWEVERARRAKQAAKEEAGVRKQFEVDGVRVWTLSELSDHGDAVVAAEDDDDEAAPSTLEPWLYVTDPAGGDHDLDDLPIAPADHASCPGHGALLDRTEVHYVCTDPEQHRELIEQTLANDGGNAEQMRQQRAAQQADVEAAQALERDLDAAAAARRAHLRDRLEEVGLDRGAKILWEQIMTHARGTFRLTVLADVLQPVRAENETLEQAVERTLRGQSLLRLAALLDIAVHADDEDTLARKRGWPNGGDQWSASRCADWRDRLAEVWGYQWTDFERGLLEPPAPAVVEVNLPGDGPGADE